MCLEGGHKCHEMQRYLSHLLRNQVAPLRHSLTHIWQSGLSRVTTFIKVHMLSLPFTLGDSKPFQVLIQLEDFEVLLFIWVRNKNMWYLRAWKISPPSMTFYAAQDLDSVTAPRAYLLDLWRLSLKRYLQVDPFQLGGGGEKNATLRFLPQCA